MISFAYEDTDWRLSSEDEVAQWMALVLGQHGYSAEALTVVFCSDAFVLHLNRTYLDHDYSTDILTFNYTPEGSRGLIGDLFISVSTVHDNAAEFEVNEIDEMHRVIIHGALHLMGYDDVTESGQKEMRHQEETALNLRMF